jgi:RNA polymerase sigma-70 factor (TIGR02960 family)
MGKTSRADADGGENVSVTTDELLLRAQGGDGEAFRQLTEPFHREIQVHCYRMLGSFQDAEDAFQDTLLNVWRSLPRFEGRASLRTWLYRIATNQCLNARRSDSRRQAKDWNVPNVEPPEPTQLGEVVWLQPLPDELVQIDQDPRTGPEKWYEQSESISLAFITALQVLPPRQIAVLILRDVLGFHASETADVLGSTVDSVNSALRRARSSLARHRQETANHEPPPAANSAQENTAVARFVHAYQAGDIDAVVALLTSDVFISMPPIPFEFKGTEAAARFCNSIFSSGRMFDLVRTRANGQPAFGSYLRGPDGVSHAVGLIVLTLSGDRISAMTRFENTVMAWFGLPRSLPSLTTTNGPGGDGRRPER